MRGADTGVQMKSVREVVGYVDREQLKDAPM